MPKITLKPDQIEELLEEKTVPRIAQEINTTYKTLYIYINKHNIEIPKRDKAEEIIEEHGIDVIKKLADSKSYDEMGRILNCSATTVCRILAKYNIQKRDMRNNVLFEVRG
jgi:DNA invertase Pin-like site-specific DNA recombinase